MLRAAYALCLLTLPALAEDSMDAPLAAWLADDDATALPALAALAQAGDERAMLFLGAVEARAAPTDWLLGLDRKTRNALLRQPGGLSGKTWLSAVVDARPMADALMAATREFDPAPLDCRRANVCGTDGRFAHALEQSGRGGLAGCANAHPQCPAASDMDRGRLCDAAGNGLCAV